MGRAGKKYRKAREAVAVKPTYPLPEAVAAVTQAAFAKFDETVEVAMRLGVDPKHADQMVRGTVVLPHGLGGKSKVVLVVASGEKLKEAQEAGADALELNLYFLATDPIAYWQGVGFWLIIAALLCFLAWRYWRPKLFPRSSPASATEA